MWGLHLCSWTLSVVRCWTCVQQVAGSNPVAALVLYIRASVTKQYNLVPAVMLDGCVINQTMGKAMTTYSRVYVFGQLRPLGPGSAPEPHAHASVGLPVCLL